MAPATRLAAGCTAITGVEAVSNGVGEFKEPTIKHARISTAPVVSAPVPLIHRRSRSTGPWRIRCQCCAMPSWLSVKDRKAPTATKGDQPVRDAAEGRQ